MELGEKLKQARLEAGLSQRQLCGDTITRNMLSLIEHGTAKPSMDTLRLLAARLGKPVSFFLEEDVKILPNEGVMDRARAEFDAGDYAAALQILEEFQGSDPIYQREKALMETLSLLSLAEQAVEAGRLPYARELLEKASEDTAYCQEEIRRRKLLLLGKLPGNRVSDQLPSLDGELKLRAEEALEAGDPHRAACLLDAAEDRNDPAWNLLRGRTEMKFSRFRDAAACLTLAEKAYPRETIHLLEICYRELEDYKLAYAYARKRL